MRRRTRPAAAKPKPPRSAEERTRHTRMILFAVLAVLAAVVLPQRLTGGIVESTHLDGQQLRDQATQLHERATQAAVVRANRADFDRRAKTALAQLPQDAQLGTLIGQIETAVRHTGMRWVSGTPTNAVTEDGVSAQAWGLEISVQGPETSVRPLLTALGTLDRLVIITNLNVQREEGGTVTVNLSLRFYALGGNG